MYPSNKNTAVLIFIRSEKEEAEAKKFGSCLSDAGNFQIAALLNKRIKSIAEKSGLPTVVIGSNQQFGDNFGERFSNSVQRVFAKGYENVIAIGNDCLSISPTLLCDAAHQLTTKKVVLGPTEDGGVYLLGFQKNAFCPKQLTKLPWQTVQLFDSLLNHFENLAINEFHLFEMSIDADDAKSFQAVLNHLQNHSSFTKILNNLLQCFLVEQPIKTNFQSQPILYNNLSHRGPPVLFSFLQ